MYTHVPMYTHVDPCIYVSMYVSMYLCIYVSTENFNLDPWRFQRDPGTPGTPRFPQTFADPKRAKHFIPHGLGISHEKSIN